MTSASHDELRARQRPRSRRELLGMVGGLAFGTIAGACTSGGGGTGTSPSVPTSSSTSAPAGSDPAAPSTSVSTTASDASVSTTTEAPTLLGALRAGGHVIYFRHGATTWSGVDDISWPREQQRLLSDEGIEQSERIGRAFELAAIPVGEVMASPFARCRDMAEIAFGRVEERDELLGLLSDDTGTDARIAFLTAQLSTPPSAGTNRILVAHRSNIEQVAGVALAEGEGVVVRPSDGGFTVLAQMMPADWPTQ